MNVVVMGVEGVGKTTIGIKLAEALKYKFIDADQFHPQSNIDKMKNGIPLTDADRLPWLKAMHAELQRCTTRNEYVVLACSALKQSYRELLGRDLPIKWVYLKASPEVIRERVEHRIGHFAKVSLLDSQLATLEEPKEAIIADADRSPDEIVKQILTALN